VSLILEALRKLDRDRSTAEPGVVVVGAQPWPAARRAPRLALLALASGALLALGFWLGAHPRKAAPAPTPSPGGELERTERQETGIEAPIGSHEARRTGARATLPPPTVREALPATETTLTTPAQPEHPSRAKQLHAAPETDASVETASPSAQDDIATPSRRTTGALPRLQAIGHRDSRPIAILEERVMGEGDEFDGVKVIQIGETTVEIEVSGQRHTLRF
jgi:hypothetical protein